MIKQQKKRYVWRVVGIVGLTIVTGLSIVAVIFWMKTPPIEWTTTDGKPEKGIPKVELVTTLLLDSYAGTVAWSPDGRYLATSEYYDKIVKIWDTKSWRKLYTIRKKTMGTNRMLFMPDSETLIVSSTQLGVDRSALTSIDASSGKIVRQIDGPNGVHEPDGWPLANKPRAFDLSKDGKRLFVSYLANKVKDWGVYVYDTQNWTTVSIIRPQWGAMVVAAGPLVNQLTTVDVKGILQIWEVPKGKLIREFPVTSSTASTIAIDGVHGVAVIGQSGSGTRRDQASGKIVPYGDVDTIRVWDFKTGRKRASAIALDPIVSVSAQNGLVVASTQHRRTVLYRMRDMKELAILRRFRVGPSDVSFSSDGKLLAIGGDGAVLIYSIDASGE